MAICNGVSVDYHQNPMYSQHRAAASSRFASSPPNSSAVMLASESSGLTRGAVRLTAFEVSDEMTTSPLVPWYPIAGVPTRRPLALVPPWGCLGGFWGLWYVPFIRLFSVWWEIRMDSRLCVVCLNDHGLCSTLGGIARVVHYLVATFQLIPL